jgi:hypothetical protein
MRIQLIVQDASLSITNDAGEVVLDAKCMDYKLDTNITGLLGAIAGIGTHMQALLAAAAMPDETPVTGTARRPVDVVTPLRPSADPASVPYAES